MNRRLNFGKELKKIREEAGLCVKELAHHAGVCPGAIYAYERGDAKPSLEKAESLLIALDYEFDIHKVEWKNE
jgi:predicted transcriptional regulator